MKTKPKTKAQWRVAIMRDVIEQLNAQRIIAQSGTYFATDMPLSVASAMSLNQEALLRESAPVCAVCMLGATFLSVVRLANEYEGSFRAIDSHVMHMWLRDYFTTRQRNTIEVLFEGFYDPGVRASKLSWFYMLDDETRVRFIAGYIIRHKGRFNGALSEVENQGTTAIEKAAAAFGKREQARRTRLARLALGL